jgi:hypothetical protein
VSQVRESVREEAKAINEELKGIARDLRAGAINSDDAEKRSKTLDRRLDKLAAVVASRKRGKQ